jgi:predicted transcriptional regulator
MYRNSAQRTREPAMKQVRQGSVTLISGDDNRGAYVVDDFGNMVKLSDDQLDDVIDRHLSSYAIRKAGEPC